MRAFPMRFLPVPVTSVAALLSSRPTVDFSSWVGGGCWDEVDGTKAPGKGERRGQGTGPSASTVARGNGRRRGAEKASGSGVVRCKRLARIRHSCAPAGGNEGRMQHASGAVDRTGMVHANCGNGGPAPRRQTHPQRPAEPDKPASPVVQAQSSINSARDE
jgi:hypothetical protein